MLVEQLSSVPLEKAAMVGGAVVAVVLVLSVGAHSVGAPSASAPSVADDVAQQSARWHHMATQDADPLVKYHHLLMAEAYLNVARRIASDDAIRRAARVEPRVMLKRIDTAVQSVERQLASRCAKGAAPSGAAAPSRRASWIS
jgi:hypothetical protein